MKQQPAFARFEAALGKEHRARNEKEVEAGLIEAPRVKPRKPRKPPVLQESIGVVHSRHSRDGTIHVTVAVPPRFTGAAALTAEREGSTTDEVASRWLKHVALHESHPKIDPGVAISVKMAIGGTFSADNYADLLKIAEAEGEDPGALAARFIREALTVAGQAKMNALEKPTEPGWWWWRSDLTNPWQALEVVEDKTKGELLVRTVEDDLYQCDGDPEHEWRGEWHPVKLEPPDR